ncbi:FecR family protein [Fibrella aquatilis]|uniref:FecR domain-containing protein n=1 Tax=Fibrella aquatilis TaxID=2817059 RepID=A0A939K0H4_9BACT|nr:FecR family protein [Fibrella aquatilis]MBO0932006.1 FecR domain-containing protein [Fibrella aquatilis]
MAIPTDASANLPLLDQPTFREWVYAPTPPSDAYWRGYLAAHPDRITEADEARALLLTLRDDITERHPSDDKVATLFAAIQAEAFSLPVRKVRWGYRRLGWAAAALVVLVGGWLTWQAVQPAPTLYAQQTAKTNIPLLESVNRTNRPQLVMLSDGSSVMLQPGSRLSYAAHFDTVTRREVYLTGDAFFEVAKQPNRPFFVYADYLVAKVLGTSFRIRAMAGRAQIQVRTGRVAVYDRADASLTDARNNPTELAGTVLLPNQQAVLTNHQIQLSSPAVASTAEAYKSIPLQPTVPDAGAMVKQSFDFDDQPVGDVFDLMARTYGVTIDYDAPVGRCLLTASLTDEPFYQKLNLICKGIEARYTVKADRIVVSGRGCP